MHIVMTGGTGGIGLVAARQFIKHGADLTIGARAPGKAPADLKHGARIEALDLADLADVDRFSDRIQALAPIDALVLNAGLQVITGTRSAQGLELSFAVNHLAHFRLIELLNGRLAPGARVILTSSGTHDPDLKIDVPPPRHADARRLARPETDSERDTDPTKAGRRAYSSSKLCNVMIARELAVRWRATRPDVAAIAYDPGFTPGTGLARDYPGLLPLLFRHLLPLTSRGPRVSTPAISGGHLARLALDPAFGQARGAYFAVRGAELLEVEPSVLARDDGACATLWDDTAALLAEVA